MKNSPYVLELWNAVHSQRISYLDRVDEDSVRVNEILNGEHTLDFRLDYNDPAVSSIAPRQMVRLTDERTQFETTVTTANVAVPEIFVSDNSGLSAGDFFWVQSDSFPYATKVTSTEGTTRVVVSTVGDSDTNHNSVRGYLADFEMYRIMALEDIRDELGNLLLEVECEHFSYDLSNMPYQNEGRLDASFSQFQQEGVVVETNVTPTDCASSIITALFDANSFTVGQIDPTDRKEISFVRDTPLSAWRKMAETWTSDMRVNLDYTADLLHFLGTQSKLQVRYRKNMAGLRKRTDASSLATIIRPVGAETAWEDTYSGVIATLPNTDHTRSKIYFNSVDNHRFRYGDAIAIWYDPTISTPTSATENTITNTVETFSGGKFIGSSVLITAGKGAGQLRQIKEHTSTTITIYGTWKVIPDVTSTYIVAAFNPEITQIIGFGLATGTASGGAVGFLDDSTQSWEIDLYAGGSIEILEGTGAGQFAEIASNTGTRITFQDDFVTAPDATSEYRLKAKHDKSTELTVEELQRIPANNDRAILALTEEPLTPGKDFNYRTTFVQEFASSDPSTIQIDTVRDFSDVYGIRIYETVLNSQGIPQRREAFSIVETQPNSFFLLLRNSLSFAPNSFAQIEAISFASSTAINTWGEIARVDYNPDIHAPFELAQEGLKKLHKFKGPRTEYDIRMGDLYEFDNQVFDQDKVNVGDLFDVLDDEITTSQTLTNTNVFATNSDASSIYDSVSATPVPDWVENQWRGSRFVSGEERRVILTNNASQLVTERFGTVPSDGAAFAIQSAQRVVEKSWNPANPMDLSIKIANPVVPLVFDTISEIEEQVRAASNHAARAVQLSRYPVCNHWDSVQKRCRRTNYPNWFCQSDASNRDGKFSKELKPITHAHCSAFRSSEVIFNSGSDATATSATVTGVNNNSFDNTSRFAVDIDNIVSTDSYATVIGIFDEAAPTSAIDVATAEARIQIDSFGDVVPFDTTTRKGCFVQVRRASGSLTLTVRALGIIFGHDG